MTFQCKECGAIVTDEHERSDHALDQHRPIEKMFREISPEIVEQTLQELEANL